MSYRFSVVVPAYNSCTTLRLVLRCLENQSFEKDRFECIVADDGSSDDTKSLLESYSSGFDFNVVTLPVNSGRSAARNAGTNEAGGEILAFLDADMLPDPDWLIDLNEEFERGEPGVVSGRRYHLDCGTETDDIVRSLATYAETTPEELFVSPSDAAIQFARIKAQSRLGMYPDRSLHELESRFPSIVDKHPESIVCAYSFVTSNVAVRRSLFEKAHGFDTGLRRGEDTDLGIRLWKMKTKFRCSDKANAYHLFYAGQKDRPTTLAENMAFVYRHPYQAVLLFFLWNFYRNQDLLAPPHPMFGSIEAFVEGKDRYYSIDVENELRKIFNQSFPIYCIRDKAYMVDFFHNHSGISRNDAGLYLDRAIEEGIIGKRNGNDFLFDLIHTSNWMHSSTLYKQYGIEHARLGWLKKYLEPEPGYSKTLAKKTFLVPKRAPLKVAMSAAYSITIPAPREDSSAFYINIPLPVQSPNQSDVKFGGMDPGSLYRNLSANSDMIERYPVDFNGSESVTLRYEFSCVVSESFSGSDGSDHAFARMQEFTRPAFPASCGTMLHSLLKTILPFPVHDTHLLVKKIYGWLVANELFFQSYSQEQTVLYSGGGPCTHLARLMIELLRLMKIPCRERCGAVLDRDRSSGGSNAASAYGTGISVFTHSWPEYYSGDRGWVPVELAQVGNRKCFIPGVNVDEQALDSIEDEIAYYSDYNFGNIDPFRIYASPRAGRIPTYPYADGKVDLVTAEDIAIRTEHTLVCEYKLL